MRYDTFLKLYGFKSLINKGKTTTSYEVVVEDGKVVTKETVNIECKWYQQTCIRLCVNISYHICILLLLLWLPAFSIAKAVREKNVDYATSHLYYVVFVIQYILGVIYYNTDHFEKILEHNMIDRKIPTKMYIASTCVAIATTLIISLLIGLEENATIYVDTYTNATTIGKVFLLTLQIVENLYTYNIFMINAITFSLVFIVHSRKITHFENTLEKKIDDAEILDVNTITSDYQELKNDYAESVSMWNNFFSTLTLLGLLAMYFIVTDNGKEHITITEYINCAYFVLVDIVYIYIIDKVGSAVGSIRELITKPKFINMYRNVNHIEELDEIVIDNGDDLREIKIKLSKINNIVTRNLMKSYENGFSNEWQIFNDQLLSEWDGFSLMGFDMRDYSLVKKAIAIFISFVIAAHVNQEFFS